MIDKLKEIHESMQYCDDGHYNSHTEEIGELIKQAEKPFRVVEIETSRIMGYFGSLKEAKTFYPYDYTECLCVNGEWVKVG